MTASGRADMRMTPLAAAHSELISTAVALRMDLPEYSPGLGDA